MSKGVGKARLPFNWRNATGSSDSGTGVDETKECFTALSNDASLRGKHVLRELLEYGLINRLQMADYLISACYSFINDKIARFRSISFSTVPLLIGWHPASGGGFKLN